MMSSRFFVAMMLVIPAGCMDGPADGFILRQNVDSGVRTDQIASCERLPRLESQPQIDGQPELGLLTVPMSNDLWFNDATNDASTRPDDVNVQWAAGHGTFGLYFLVEIDTPRLSPATADLEGWCGDGVEIYVDHDAVFRPDGRYDDMGTQQFLVTAPVAGGTSRRGEVSIGFSGSDRPWPSTRFAAFARPGGYTVEAIVTPSDFDLDGWTIEAGNPIGFNLGINVSRTDASQNVLCGSRLGQLFLRATEMDPPYNSTRAFCVATLAP
jgi:hypothetical protein